VIPLLLKACTEIAESAVRLLQEAGMADSHGIFSEAMRKDMGYGKSVP
jgi:hypothetical protein